MKSPIQPYPLQLVLQVVVDGGVQGLVARFRVIVKRRKEGAAAATACTTYKVGRVFAAPPKTYFALH